MGIFRKFIKSLDFSRPAGKSYLSRYGEVAEDFLRDILSKSGYAYYFNRLIPDKNRRHIGEIDAIIYGEGNIYCVEVKRYKGIIELEGKDHSEIAIYRKVYGYESKVKSYPNPMLKTKYRTRKLKEYLITRDRRFKKVAFIPVVAFCDGDSDISSIHSFDRGFIYVSEILDFIKFHRNERFAGIYQSWIKDEIEKLPMWDYIKNTEGEWIYGKLVDDAFSCKTLEGDIYRIYYCDVKAIFVHDFDSHYLIVIRRLDGGSEEVSATKGKVRINTLNSIRTFPLKHIKEIFVGMKNFRLD